MKDSALKDGDLPAFAAELGIPGLFDVHVHFMHPRVMAKVWAYFDGVGSGLWPVQYRGTRRRARRAPALDGGAAVHLPLLRAQAGHRGLPERLDARVRRAHARHAVVGDVLSPSRRRRTTCPKLVDAGVEVFKAHLQVGDFAADDPLLEPVWGTLAGVRHADRAACRARARRPVVTPGRTASPACWPAIRTCVW